jgi:hypothetical protein
VVCAGAVSDSRSSQVILSLGAGVQSTTIALMSLRGELPAQFAPPTAAIFADTGYEPANVYSHLQWLIDTLSPKLPVHVVRAMRPDGSAAHIREHSEAIVRGDTARMANPPLFVKESVEYTAHPNSHQHARFNAFLVRRGEIPRLVTMPLFAREFTGAKTVMLRRQCTGDYKIEPIYRFCRTQLGRRRGQRRNTPLWRNVDRHLSRREREALQALAGGVGHEPPPTARAWSHA